jgi:Fe-S-cluster containining protein
MRTFKFESWANLELHTFDITTEKDQPYKAAFLEGYVTGDMIEMSCKNLKEDMYENKRKFCESFKAFVEENTVFIKSQIEKYSETNDYWHQLNLIYKHMEGMEKRFELWQK